MSKQTKRVEKPAEANQRGDGRISTDHEEARGSRDEAPKGLFEAAWKLLIQPLPAVARKLIIAILALGGVILAIDKLLPIGCSATVASPSFVVLPGEVHIKGGTNPLTALKVRILSEPRGEGVSTITQEIQVERLLVDSNAEITVGSDVAKVRIVAEEAIFKGPLSIKARGENGQNGTPGTSPSQPGYGARGGNGSPGSHGTAGQSGKDVELWLGLRSLQQVGYLTIDARGGKGGNGGRGGGRGSGGWR